MAACAPKGCDGSSGNEDVTCSACGEQLRHDHVSLRCPQGHHLCSECTATFVASQLGLGPMCLPIKCWDCKVEVPRRVFEMQLDDAQRMEYIMFVSATELAAGEAILSCPFCSYFEIWQTDPSDTFFTCKVPTCAKFSCIHCNLALPPPDEDGELSSEEHVASIDMHYGHTELAPFKRGFDAAILDGTQVACPNKECKVYGVKDDACMHMTCDGCATEWCYFCCQSIDEIDKAAPAEMLEAGIGNVTEMYRHNVNWVGNPARCPMF